MDDTFSNNLRDGVYGSRGHSLRREYQMIWIQHILFLRDEGYFFFQMDNACSDSLRQEHRPLFDVNRVPVVYIRPVIIRETVSTRVNTTI